MTTSAAYSPAVHEQNHRFEAVQSNLAKLDAKTIRMLTGLSGADSTISGRSVRKWLQEGSWPEDIGPDIMTSHFYNPLSNQGLTWMGAVIGESAYDRANNASS
ncbi:MAG: hypothetical protein M0C28_16995 [Candidatus Moduliflexus flocculans]|nr:hypothetical protein [Candidatus Moduliflexus flocculans]